MMSKLYNEEIKEKFLNNYDNEQTQKTIRNVFAKTELIESVLEKDLMFFSIEEIGKAIENTNPHNAGVAKSSGRFISQYISWAIGERLRKNVINPLQGVLPNWYDKFVDHSKKVFYSKKEFLELLNSMLNGQDQAFLVLIWNGIIGKSFSQLRELKFSDINFDNNEVYVKERDMSIKIDDDLMKYLQNAYNQTTFFTYNPETNDHNESELLPSEYLFKNVKSPRSQEGVQVNPSVFYTRINNLKNEFDLEYLTPNSIKMSGMLYQAYLLFKEFGVLRYEQFAEIGEKYDYNRLTSNNMTYFNTNLMKQFITPENIKELYDIDITIERR